MKRKLMIFLLVLSIGIIITYPSFPVSHALDSYCTVYNGYSKTAFWFLQNGRVITFLFYLLFNVINLPMFSLGYISALITNIFISLSIVALYEKIKNNLKFEKTKENVLLLLSVFLIFYNPLFVSILVLDEAFIIALGIYFLTLSAINCYKGDIKHFCLSLILGILGIFCYQGIASYLFVILLLLLITDKDHSWKKFVVKNTIALLNYFLSFLINFIVINIVSNCTNKTIAKVGEFNFIDNLIKIFTDLLPNSLHNYFGYVNVKHYCLIVIIAIIILIISIVLNKNKFRNIIFAISLMIACLIIPFGPNLFMSATSNYTDARMTLTIISVPICFIILTLYINKNKLINLGALIVIMLYFIMTAYLVHQNMMIDLKRYKNDNLYISDVYAKILKYETDNEIKIKNIYYAYDTDSAYYYSFGNANGVNIRVMAVDWAFECAFPIYTNKDYKLQKMSDLKYKKYFANLNYDELDDKQFVFDGDSLYLLIY